MRENGAETRRIGLAIFLFGDLPAGAVNGVRGEDMFAFGVDMREGMIDGGGIDFCGVRLNVKGFTGLANASFLIFLVGESKTAGSTFSLSKSS